DRASRCSTHCSAGVPPRPAARQMKASQCEGYRPSHNRSEVLAPPGAALSSFTTGRLKRDKEHSSMARQTSSGEHYTLISSDTHAGGSHAQYREFLDPKFREDFDAWRSKYRNPFRDLGDDRRLRNWDDEMRNSQQDSDGVVGEVIFPNTVPPF